MAQLTETAGRFPLAPRYRPPCPPLAARVSHLGRLAQKAADTADTTSASAVYNAAALLASDLGLPGLARKLCADHTAIFFAARPLPPKEACHSLAPLVNLANLRIREGDADGAFRLLHKLHRAVATCTDATVDGITVPVTTLTANETDFREVAQWVRGTFLVDGSRALVRAGRWAQARDHLERPGTIGRRMFEGRQIAVLALATGGDTSGALDLVADTLPGDPWEATVTACLAALCRRHAGQPSADPAPMLDGYEQHQREPQFAVFDTRLGLALIDVAGGTSRAAARTTARSLIVRTLEHDDGYTAREVLAHPGCFALLTDTQHRQLAATVAACGLGQRVIPPRLRTDLARALERSRSILVRSFAGKEA
ncbi:hypothetical protein ACFVXG_01470 [Kitasatospora sp. NPDC058162]|uniref:hypothetical protein n=1 Tax=Kitasatospora sp. NPDC058162 TaxID=3346362 RepID=UPI0036DB9067